jgi:RNA polymerase sigma-70 factor (ECF subfamily)
MTSPPDNLDQRLLAARKGSAAALGDVLEACRAYLLGIAARELEGPLRAKGGASDLVQETFLEAQRDFPRFQGSTESELLAWLRRMLLNNLANFARHYRGTDKRQIQREVFIDPHASASSSTPLPASDTPTPSAEVMADEQSQALAAALARLPEDYRRILTLRYLEGYSFEEIGQKMERTNNAVRKLWARAVLKLQDEFDSA